MQPCASYRLGCGTGRRRTHSGHTSRGGRKRCPRVRSTTESVCSLLDPLAVPDALLALAREREPVIVLTAPWHERDSWALVERLDATLFAPRADTAQDLIDKYGITAEQAVTEARTWSGFGAAAIPSIGTGQATGSRSESRRTRAASTTTSFCGSRVTARSLRVIRLPASEQASR
jgi:hypothetical protein